VASALTDGLPPALMAQFKLLQQRFVLSLPARWREISQAATPLMRQSALHRLAGSAGSYDFECMSQLARQAEALTGPSDTAALVPFLDALEREIARITAV